MAQHLRPDRPDNRGGNKPVTSTKRPFSWKIERSKYDELKACAIKLNREAENDKLKYTVVSRRIGGLEDVNHNLSLTKDEAIAKIKLLKTTHPKNAPIIYEIHPLPCNTTEK